MTILVLSDTHGMTDRVQEVLSRHTRSDALLFLGDGIRDLPDEVYSHPTRLFGGVRGNCDFFSPSHAKYSFSDELLLNVDAYTVMMMHGHRHSVKSGTDAAIRYAASRGADILLYGHTHIPEERYLPEGSEIGGIRLKKPLHVFNPGSLGYPPDGVPSFGVIEIRNGRLLFSHGTLTR